MTANALKALCFLALAGAAHAAPAAPAQTAEQLGQAIFFDGALSEPAGTSCASCHDPATGYAGNHGSTSGVAQGARPDLEAKRNTPQIRYLKFVPPFHFHWGEDAPLPDAYGGLFWDGRADTIQLAAQQPLLNPKEMANPDAAAVMAKVARASYGEAFYALYPAARGDATRTLAAVGAAVQAYLSTDAMAPFSSRFDDYLRGKIQLTDQEARGLALFQDAEHGGCDSCHVLNTATNDPTRSLFTDFGYESPGVPRNRHLAATQDATYFDLGVCGRTDNPLAADPRLCGQFRTPSLRNVATRRYFMHNGALTSLHDVLLFYATRSTDPTHWYPTGVAFDDVPDDDRGQIDVTSVPYNRAVGQTPLLDDADQAALEAFLRTLTDADLQPVSGGSP